MVFLQVDLNNKLHEQQLIRLLDCYMQDEMGNGEPMTPDLGPLILDGLKQHPGYLGFFVVLDQKFAALANCNKNFSTFKARPLINIHDLIVHPDFRGRGVGTFLLDAIAAYGKENGYCRINLEVRQDNMKARNLYRKVGYGECDPCMFFWERVL